MKKSKPKKKTVKDIIKSYFEKESPTIEDIIPYQKIINKYLLDEKYRKISRAIAWPSEPYRNFFYANGKI